MSHSRGLLPLDRPGFEVLIRAGGTGEVGARGAGGKSIIDSSVARCAATLPHVFISPHLRGV